jgi:hypothetical protein
MFNAVTIISVAHDAAVYFIQICTWKFKPENFLLGPAWPGMMALRLACSLVHVCIGSMMRSDRSSSPVSVAGLARGGWCMPARGHRPSGFVGCEAIVCHMLQGSPMNLMAEGALCCCWRWRPLSPCHPSGRFAAVGPRSTSAPSWPSPRSAHWEQAPATAGETPLLFSLPSILCRALPLV